MSKIPYYPGCTLKNKASNFESSALAAARVLDLELVELPRWNCCGAVFSLSADDLMRHIAPTNIFLRVQEMNRDHLVENEYRLVTLCAMCFNVLRRTNQRLRENLEDRNKINDFSYLETETYQGQVEIVHLLELLRSMGWDTIRQKVTQPLAGFKIAPYYGCMLLRPKDVGLDDPERPSILEELLRSLGADPVDFPLKLRCCGSYQTVPDKNLVADLAYDILSRAQKAGAEAITTSCPLCAFNLDFRQKEIREKTPTFLPIPVFYFTQLMAIAFGLPQEVAGLAGHYADPKTLLASKGVLQTTSPHEGGEG
jgi:heterodisulfide reductase subunit B